MSHIGEFKIVFNCILCFNINRQVLEFLLREKTGYKLIKIKYPKWVPVRDGVIIEINQIKSINFNLKLFIQW